MTFRDPALLLLLLPALLLVAISLSRRRSPHIRLSVTSHLQGLPVTFRQRIAASLPFVRLVAVFLLVIALARPQIQRRDVEITSKGVDIALAIDVSTSMLAVDRSDYPEAQARIEIAKKVVREFITRRSGDRIGLIAFAARPYQAAPLTLDHHWLVNSLEQLRTGDVEDGTALGDALMAAIRRLQSSPEASRTILLVTDGRNNAGAAVPAVAAQVARTLGIKIYAIGIGSEGDADFPVEDPLGGVTLRRVAADLDATTLTTIAETTGGSFYRASDAESLRSVLGEIDRLVRRPLAERVNIANQEVFPLLLMLSFIVLAIETTLSSVLLRKVP